jgi:hypothetical protein
VIELDGVEIELRGIGEEKDEQDTAEESLCTSAGADDLECTAIESFPSVIRSASRRITSISSLPSVIFSMEEIFAGE